MKLIRLNESYDKNGSPLGHVDINIGDTWTIEPEEFKFKVSLDKFEDGEVSDIEAGVERICDDCHIFFGSNYFEVYIHPPYRSRRKLFHVFRCPDEWYILITMNNSDICYRCDQMQGLMDCIESNINIRRDVSTYDGRVIVGVIN